MISHLSSLRVIAFVAYLVIFQSCETIEKKSSVNVFEYNAFKDSLKKLNSDTIDVSSNVFDAKTFIPGVDSLDTFLIRIDSLWHRDVSFMELMDSLKKNVNKKNKYTSGEKAVAKENVKNLDSFLLNNNNKSIPSACKAIECVIYAEIIKSKQKLYLYIQGALMDSFLVSTGIKKYETPDLNVKPRGPLLMKYNSKKFPGGNYKGMGNMPYAVFVRGGYAVHGTTPGNFSKLGTKASHGCIRLHPDNARIFFELVKRIGLDNSWVTIKDSLP